MQDVVATEEPPPPSTFLVEDVVEVICDGVGEEGKLVGYEIVINVEGGTLHGVSNI